MSRSQTWKRDLVIWASPYLCPTNCQLLATPLSAKQETDEETEEKVQISQALWSLDCLVHSWHIKFLSLVCLQVVMGYRQMRQWQYTLQWRWYFVSSPPVASSWLLSSSSSILSFVRISEWWSIAVTCVLLHFECPSHANLFVFNWRAHYTDRIGIA